MNRRKVVGIYLAAGCSTRMGCNKLLLPIGKEILASIALKTALASELNHIIVVTDSPSILPSVLGEKIGDLNKVTFAACENSNKGISYSLKCGVKIAREMHVDGAIIFLADQPFLAKETLNKLICAFHKNYPSDFIAACYQNVIRPPILIDQSLFPFVKTLNGDVGFRKLLNENLFLKGQMLHSDNEQEFFDIDTIADYQKVVRRG